MTVCKYFVILFLIISASFLNAKAQTNGTVRLPDNIAGKRAAAFLNAMNSKGDEVLSEFVKNNMTPNDEIKFEERVDRFRGMREQFGGLILKRLLKSTDESISLIVQNGRNELLKLILELDRALQSRIAGIQLDRNTSENTGLTETKKLSEKELPVEVEKYLNDLTAKDEFSGAVLIAKRGQVIFSKAFGLASRELNVPNRIDTKFNIGSINKIFTALAIGQMADAGKLSLDDKLGKHLPDYPNHQAAEKITIRHLLNMSSGIGDFFGEQYEATPKDRIRNLQDYFPFFASKPLLFEPGTSRRYSNGGYIVLGAIIEKLSGQNYYDYVRENIYKPAGMMNTDSYQSDLIISNIASGYTRNASNDGLLRNNFYTRPARGSSAGGGYSTVEDLLKFALALETGKLAIPKSLSSDETGRILTGGLGIAGGAPGLNAAVDSKIAGEYVIVVTSNLDPPSAEKVARQIRAWLGAND